MVLKVFIPIILQILCIAMEVGRIEAERKEGWGIEEEQTHWYHTFSTIPASTHLFIEIFLKELLASYFPWSQLQSIRCPIPHKKYLIYDVRTQCRDQHSVPLVQTWERSDTAGCPHLCPHTSLLCCLPVPSCHNAQHLVMGFFPGFTQLVI